MADHWAGHEIAGHENARQETSSEAANVWGRIDWVVCYDSSNVEDQSRVGLIHRLERHYLLQRLVRRLPRQRQHRRQQHTTAVRCAWSGDETASHLSRETTLVSVPLAIRHWAPAARFVARRSRWWCVSITETVATIMTSVAYNWYWLDSVPLFVIGVFWINFLFVWHWQKTCWEIICNLRFFYVHSNVHTYTQCIGVFVSKGYTNNKHLCTSL